MNRILLVMALLLIISCQKDQGKSSKTLANLEKVEHIKNNEQSVFEDAIETKNLYSIDLTYNQLGDNTFALVIDMTLKDDAHYVSPNSKVAYKGRFTLSLKDHKDLELIGNLMEAPETVEEIDLHPFINGPVNWVRENTRYEQRIKINTNDDFQTYGVIQFTIEPRCTLEKIPVAISYHEGKFKFVIDNC